MRKPSSNVWLPRKKILGSNFLESGSKLRTFAGSHRRPEAIGAGSILLTADERLIVFGTDAGTALFDVATGDELCLLIALVGDDWLAVTPEGLFDGSPAGISKVTYRIGNGLTIVPAEQMTRGFRHPGLLANLFKGERPQPPTAAE